MIRDSARPISLMAPFSLPVQRVAVVTGAARGIGRSIALHLGRAGHDVAVVDLVGSSVQDVARELKVLGRRSMALHADVSKEDEVKAMVNDVANKLGSIDIVSRLAVDVVYYTHRP